MPAKRNDVEEIMADRETALTRATLAWALVLVILFWITSNPPPGEGRSVQLWIRGSLVQGVLVEAMRAHRAKKNAPRVRR
jgi:type IV secretory pathway TrbD component